ncbi:hypothetical protein ISF_10015 [Cordyceps fumosorosea ARSEF 2679]|uniref:Uncharacterized protein n=1 Tax=Cordyceps fumosorosea (strain ARSEF 2679) TaxID=1081104 RepID=A0A166W6U2_CORFA|nr:hypothetical protein ISF_10015 [Cordyceps fumosorosea ARSEF 2679]OAA34401.1 hypothetical protein ISF_10015 [Cordyceps fumosorosea ARSEF 2679]
MHPMHRLLKSVVRMFHDTRSIVVVDLILHHHGKIKLHEALNVLPFSWNELQNTIRLLVMEGYLRLDPDELDMAYIREHGLVYASYGSTLSFIAAKLEASGALVNEILHKDPQIFSCPRCHKGCGALDAWPEGGTIMTCPGCGAALSLVPANELERQEQHKEELCMDRRVLADLLKAAQLSPLAEPHVPGAHNETT